MDVSALSPSVIRPTEYKLPFIREVSVCMLIDVSKLNFKQSIIADVIIRIAIEA